MTTKQTASMGTNVTGVEASGKRAEEMQRGMDAFPPTSSGSSEGPGKVRVQYARRGGDLGSVPPPAGVKGKAKAAKKKVTGAEPTVMMDKLGERLAFERTGTRLYEALISKHEASGGFGGGPSRSDLVELMNEEHTHFAMLAETMRKMDGDPTAVTPSADVAAVTSEGIMKVITDPRTTLLQSLEAILVAELADQDGWETLIELAREAGEEELADRFEEALDTEEEHLEKVRTWLRAGQGRQRATAAE